jgi:PAS domain S-box-containing protein
MEVTLSRKKAKSRTRGRKLHSTKAKARVGRARKTRADLEQQLKACRREIAHARERLAEATMQQAATFEMLRLISNSPNDIHSVLDAVAEHAVRLCDASNARIWRLEDNLLRLVASYGESSATIHGREGVPADRDTVTGRAACDRRTIHVHDLAAEGSEYPVGSRHVKDEGWRTTLATPLLREGTPIGIILVRRMEVRPFSEKQIALLETFANQAVVAIKNVCLFEAEKQRTLALAQANRDLAEREAKIRRLVDSNIIGIFIWDFEGRVLEANDEFLRMVNYDHEDLVSGRIRWADLTPPDWRDRNNARIERQESGGRFEPFEKEYTRKDGSRVPVLIGGATIEEGGNQGVAFVLDLTERKRAEQALMRSEAYLSETQKLTHTGSWAWDVRSQKVLYCSEEMFRIFGLDPLEHLPTRKNFRQRVHPEDRNRVDASFAKVVNERVDSFDEYRVLLPDGTVKHVNSSGHPVLDGNGEFIEFVGTATDVTERKCAEEALRESETKIRRLVDANIIGIFVWEFDERIIEANDAFLRMVGYDRDDLLAGRLRLADLRSPDWRDHKEELKRTGTIQPFEQEYCRKDGGRVPVLVGAATLEEGGNQGVAFVLDLTERKCAEEALRESEAKFRDYAETASDWLWETGPDYKFKLLTENAFGSDPTQRIGTTCWDRALDVETEPEKWRLVRATLDSHEPFRDFVYCTMGGSGAPMYVKASGKPVFDSRGKFRGYRGTGTDVTAIVRGQRAEASLRTAQAELAHVSRVMTLGQLTASIAHEINQPIGSARNNARAALNFLDRRPPDLGEVREALSCIVGDADRAGGIIDRVRDQIKKAPPRNDRFDLNPAIEEVIGLAQSAITESGVSVQTRLASRMAPVHGDRVQLQQVVLNLILNAVEAMSSVESGERELSIGTEQSQANGTLVTVRDSGPGIDPNHLDQVFEAFYTTKSGGMGMGLSICRSIINAHGGRLWAAANEPRGVLFQFTLPSVETNSSIAMPFARLESGMKTPQ